MSGRKMISMAGMPDHDKQARNATYAVLYDRHASRPCYKSRNELLQLYMQLGMRRRMRLCSSAHSGRKVEGE